MVRKFRLFWSYDIPATQAWLNRLSLAGLRLADVRPALRIFEFEPDTPRNTANRLCLEKSFRGQIPRPLSDAGWRCAAARGRLYAFVSDVPNPAVAPSYAGFLDRNRRIKLAAGIVLLTLLCLFLPGILLNLWLASLPDGGPVELADPLALILLPWLIIALIFAWLIFTFFKLRSSNKKLEHLSGVWPYPAYPYPAFAYPSAYWAGYGQAQIASARNSVVKKWKLAWQYAPDKMEKWLEAREQKGLNLYKISATGTRFYFVKGAPRCIKYAVDYQGKTTAQYFSLNMECGWQLMFTSLADSKPTMVWCREYAPGEPPPEFYSDRASKLQHARRLALRFSLLYLPASAVYIWLMVLFMSNAYAPWFGFVVYSAIIIEYTSFSLRAILYYFRVRRSTLGR